MKNSSDKRNIRDLAFIVLITVVCFILCFAVFVRFNKNHSNTQNNLSEKQLNSTTRKKISIIDFSDMKYEEANKWCVQNNILCKEKIAHSDSVPTGGFISQSPKHGETIEEGGEVYIFYSKGKAPTASQLNALKQAESYLKHSSFSREGLINQLVYEEYSKEDAIYAVDNVSVDWNEQAVKRAKSYLSHSAFSRNRLIKQLEYEKFTKSQAEYGVNKAGL